MGDTFYKPPRRGASQPYAFLIRLSPEDRKLLVGLTQSRGQTASAVVRELVRQASATPPPEVA